jgi:hypothetical protein
MTKGNASKKVVSAPKQHAPLILSGGIVEVEEDGKMVQKSSNMLLSGRDARNFITGARADHDFLKSCTKGDPVNGLDLGQGYLQQRLDANISIAAARLAEHKEGKGTIDQLAKKDGQHTAVVRKLVPTFGVKPAAPPTLSIQYVTK